MGYTPCMYLLYIHTSHRRIEKETLDSMCTNYGLLYIIPDKIDPEYDEYERKVAPIPDDIVNLFCHSFNKCRFAYRNRLSILELFY